MVSSDVRDMLGIPDTIKHINKKPKLVHEKRPDGISRELSALLGDSNPPVVTIQSKFKERPKFRQVAAKWTQTPFQNGARSDDLTLSHWVRGFKPVEGPSPYRFEAFNKKVDVVSYTDEEYTTYLEKPEWTREETDVPRMAQDG